MIYSKKTIIYVSWRKNSKKKSRLTITWPNGPFNWRISSKKKKKTISITKCIIKNKSKFSVINFRNGTTNISFYSKISNLALMGNHKKGLQCPIITVRMEDNLMLSWREIKNRWFMVVKRIWNLEMKLKKKDKLRNALRFWTRMLSIKKPIYFAQKTLNLKRSPIQPREFDCGFYRMKSM